MYMTKNKFILGTTIVCGSIAGLGLIMSPTYAEDTQTYPAIVENVATKFNLDRDEVHEVFQQTREERHDEPLSQMVTDGAITEEQKAVIEKHHEDMINQIDTLEAAGKTRDEIHEAMEADREEFQSWLEDEGIDMQLGGPKMHEGGRGMGEGDGTGFRMQRGRGL